MFPFDVRGLLRHMLRLSGWRLIRRVAALWVFRNRLLLRCRRRVPLRATLLWHGIPLLLNWVLLLLHRVTLLHARVPLLLHGIALLLHRPTLLLRQS